jgi:subtilisin family serine protease
MMAYRCMLSFGVMAAGLLGVEGARRLHKRPGTGRDVVSFAGVPVYNYPVRSDSLGESNATNEEDWIVVLDSAITDSEIDALCKRAKDGKCKMTGHPSAGGVPFIEVRGSPEQMETMFQNIGGLAKYVEPDTHLNMIPDDDADFVTEDVGPSSRVGWHIESIGRGFADMNGKGVNVYVFDTGIRVTHQDFTGRAVATLDVVASPSSPRECKGDATCAGDVRGHGTHCAGLVGGVNHGSAPGATIHAVKVLDDGGAGPWSNIIGGLDWVARKRVRPAVASLSLGGPGVENSVSVAVDVAVAAGITVVVAAGNRNSDACTYTPAFAPAAFTVGAFAQGNKVASFSNYGPCTNIWAPGFSILSNAPESDTATTSKSGTSMACPLVAGGAALILEATPSLTPAKVKQALSDSGVPDSIEPYRYGGGMKSGSGDTNLRLYVGAGGGGGDLPAPTPPPSSPPSRRRSRFFR